MKWDHSLIDTLEWGNQISHKEDKIKIADLIASKVENGQVIGVGSGSTSYLALTRIAERIRTERLSILAIPTSLEIRMTCAQLGIPVTSLSSIWVRASGKISTGIGNLAPSLSTFLEGSTSI